MRAWLQRIFARNSIYKVTIVYQYTDATDVLRSVATVKAVNEGDAVAQLIAADMRDPHGPERGWRSLTAAATFEKHC